MVERGSMDTSASISGCGPRQMPGTATTCHKHPQDGLEKSKTLPGTYIYIYMEVEVKKQNTCKTMKSSTTRVSPFVSCQGSGTEMGVDVYL